MIELILYIYEKNKVMIYFRSSFIIWRNIVERESDDEDDLKLGKARHFRNLIVKWNN